MAISFRVTLFLVALITAAATTLLPTAVSVTASPSQPPSPPEIRPPPSPPEIRPPPPPSSVSLSPISAPQAPTPPPPAEANKEKQYRNILDALIGSGDYGSWANLLSSANPSSLPLTATLFVPSNAAISRLLTTGAHVDSLLIPYHVVPQRLSSSDLRALPTHTRLPTLLASKFIVVTNNSPANFAVDGSQIMQPDIYLNAAFALHGVDKVLNYSVFGGGPPSPQPMTPEVAALLRRKRRHRQTTVDDHHGPSGAPACSCSTVSGILSSVCMFFTLFIFFAFKIL